MWVCGAEVYSGYVRLRSILGWGLRSVVDVWGRGPFWACGAVGHCEMGAVGPLWVCGAELHCEYVGLRSIVGMWGWDGGCGSIVGLWG